MAWAKLTTRLGIFESREEELEILNSLKLNSLLNCGKLNLYALYHKGYN